MFSRIFNYLQSHSVQRSKQTWADILRGRKLQGEKMAEEMNIIAREVDEVVKLMGPSTRPKPEKKVRHRNYGRRIDDRNDGGPDDGFAFARRRRA